MMKAYWDNIKSEFPNAFKELAKDHDTIEEWGEIDHPGVWGELVNESDWVLRHLFDFFDARKINCYCYTSDGTEWHYGIITKGRLMNPSVYKYSSRKEAELNCYEKAFELLEATL